MNEYINLALNDVLNEEIASFKFTQLYVDLYNSYDAKIKKKFSYLHQNINSLISFMNDKSKTNKHFNAVESRSLIFIIETIGELELMLKNTDLSFSINEDYKKFIEYCEGFLQSSGGSKIPDDYKRFNIVKYDTIFKMNNAIVNNAGNINFKEKVLGSGAYADVYKYKDKFYNENYAYKKLKNEFTAKELERFKKEFELLHKLNYPYILKAYNYIENDNAYVMEYCDYTLKKYYDLYNGNKEKLNFNQRKNIAMQFLRAINYLHANEILHRDISFNNILLKQYDNGLIIVKVSDFGLIKEKNSNLTSTGSEIKGTIIDDTLLDFKNYNIKNEIYAIGVVLFYIFTGKQNLDLTNNAISNIVKKCVDRNHSDRYNSVAEIMQDVIGIVSDVKKKEESVVENNNMLKINDLNELAIDMLENAVNADGIILKLQTLIGLTIQCGNKSFIPSNAKEEANIEYAMELLINNDYIRNVDHKDEVFKVTKKGFDLF